MKNASSICIVYIYIYNRKREKRSSTTIFISTLAKCGKKLYLYIIFPTIYVKLLRVYYTLYILGQLIKIYHPQQIKYLFASISKQNHIILFIFKRNLLAVFQIPIIHRKNKQKIKKKYSFLIKKIISNYINVELRDHMYYSVYVQS